MNEQSTNTASLRVQLLELMKLMPKDKLKDLAVELKAVGADVPVERKPRTYTSTTVKRKRLVTRHFTCLNCGHKWVNTLQLGKGEHVMTPGTKDGNYIVTVIEDYKPVTAQCAVVKCENCQHAISRWSREELEERYMQLLCRLSLGFEIHQKLVD